MTIWIVAMLLLAGLAGLGLRQGAIRVAASFLGIVFGALLAPLLGYAVRPLLVLATVKNPMLLALLPPAIGFFIVLVVFKIIGTILHKKIEIHYRYHSGEVRLMLWERLNHRVGLCLGLLNGAAYLVLLSMAIYMLSYWTYQMAAPESAPTTVKVVNQLGRDLESTGMNRVARAVDRAPTSYYDAADIVGLIYHNPLLEARLSHYPTLLGLAERPEFQELANDMQFNEAWQKQASIGELMNNPKVQGILKNPETIKAVHNALVPNLTDLRAYLETGISPKFSSEPLLGRWNFDLNGTLTLMRKARPNLNRSIESRRLAGAGFPKAALIGAPEGQAILKNLPRAKPGANTLEVQTFEGQWKGADGKYELTFNIDGKMETIVAMIQGDRLTLSGTNLELGFLREN